MTHLYLVENLKVYAENERALRSTLKIVHKPLQYRSVAWHTLEKERWKGTRIIAMIWMR